MDIYELFYGIPFDLKESFAGLLKIRSEKKKKDVTSSKSMKYPHTDFLLELIGRGSNGVEEMLSDTYSETFELYSKGMSLEKFMMMLKSRHSANDLKIRGRDAENTNFEHEIYKTFEVARERYFDLFAIVDYPRSRLIEELSYMFKNPMVPRISKKI